MTAAVDALRPALLAAAARLAIDLSAPQADALLDFLSLLQRWNATYNLTAVRDPAQMLIQHVADCLAVIAPLRREARRDAFRLLDVGSGGGLPGAVIAILNPRADVTCVDAVGKKVAFVQQVAAELRLPNLHAQQDRVEKLSAAPFDIITSRAFASLTEFSRLTAKHLGASGSWMAMKGKVPIDEIAELPSTVRVFHVEQIVVPGLDAERCIVWMRPVASL